MRSVFITNLRKERSVTQKPRIRTQATTSNRSICIGVIIAGVMVMGLMAGNAAAGTLLEWDRNVESDMKEYRVYLCLTNGCTAVKSGTPTAIVVQPSAGVVPAWPLPANAVGSAVVTAVDLDGNESGASNMVSFETTAPAAPSNARLR